MTDAEFLFDTQLINAVELLIKNAKHKLVIISPFIDLDKRIKDALSSHIEKHDFELQVLFGKNENNIYKSIKKDSIDFLMRFPNVDIRYNENLHAKYYQNDFDFIVTSLNLYDYSLANNIEVGIRFNYASKGLIGKAIEGLGENVKSGVDKVSHDVFGTDIELDPIEKFKSIFHNSSKKYKTEPVLAEKDGIMGVFGSKKLNGYNIVYDNLSNSAKDNTPNKTEIGFTKTTEIKPTETVSKPSTKTQSASQLSKALGVSQADITNIMQQSGLINGDKITSAGLAKGLVVKNYMGKDYIAYPDNLDELNKIKK